MDKLTAERNVSYAPLQEDEKAKYENDLLEQLAQLEKDIRTLKTVLEVKQAEASELRNKLGIGMLSELKQDFLTNFKSFKESETVQKTGTVFKNLGDITSKKLAEIKDSSTYKSFEQSVSGAYQNVKEKITAPKVVEIDDLSAKTEDENFNKKN